MKLAKECMEEMATSHFAEAKAARKKGEDQEELLFFYEEEVGGYVFFFKNRYV